jgi:hypothetical protein
MKMMLTHWSRTVRRLTHTRRICLKVEMVRAAAFDLAARQEIAVSLWFQALRPERLHQGFQAARSLNNHNYPYGHVRFSSKWLNHLVSVAQIPTFHQLGSRLCRARGQVRVLMYILFRDNSYRRMHITKKDMATHASLRQQ